MEKKSRKAWVRPLAGLLACCVLALACAGLAHLVETDLGRVAVSFVEVPYPTGGTLVAKLYRPLTATGDTPAPAVLGLHGFQNDKETMSGYAVELARRGFVVLAPDELQHGDTTAVPAADDATGGGDACFRYLEALPYVQADKIGIMGHSMGSGNMWATALANPTHAALNPQCGEARGPVYAEDGTVTYKNVLLSQAQYEEFAGFRENAMQVAPLTENQNRVENFAGQTGSIEWNVTYGSFADGTARCMALFPTVHPGVTHDARSIATTVSWMNEALRGGAQMPYSAESQIYMWKEYLMLAALLLAVASALPAIRLLLCAPFFAPCAGAPAVRHLPGKGQWGKNVALNIIIAAVTFPILCVVGVVIPWGSIGLTAMITNAVITWLLGLVLIGALLLWLWYRKARRTQGVTLYDLGISFSAEKTTLRWDIIGKSALMAVLCLALMYGLVAVSQAVFGIEFRFLWPFMRVYSSGKRFGESFGYLVFFLAFFLVNGGMWLYARGCPQPGRTPARTQLKWWGSAVLAMTGGMMVIFLLHYVPYFLGFGPGFDLAGLSLLAAGGMLPLMTIVFVPEFAVLLFVNVFCYRHTGKVYLGSLLSAALAVWFSVAGTMIA